MTEPLTLYFLVERASRLREAQRRAALLPNDYNRRQVVPLAYEVDGLVARAKKIPLYPEFLAFVGYLAEMRQEQSEYGVSGESVRLGLEWVIDALVERYTLEAKELNARLKEHNIKMLVPAGAGRKSVLQSRK